jgi:uncharacterized protein (DUF1800 family)
VTVSRICACVCLILALSGCGGGGGGSGNGNTGQNPPPTADPPPPQVSDAQLMAAADLLGRATFGPTFAEIETAAQQDLEMWLTAQFDQPPSLHMPVVERYAAEYGSDINAMPPPGLYRRFAFWERALRAPDQLRQLTAYALTQIFVISDNVDTLVIDPRALASYYDMLLVNAFGNFRDLLRDVTLHPAMGFYLSHVNNGRADPVANTFPDENYAREIMQLFTIGLFELNPDGTPRLDSQGNEIPTYSNADIREFAKIFTGLSYGPQNPGGSAFFGNPAPVLYVPMQMFDEFHEPGEKRLLNNTVVAAGGTGLTDIEAALDNLFMHPNMAPFFSRLLIQRLVTSNPSPAYVARVAQAFAGGDGIQRGDMKNVIRAVLTDVEVDQGLRLREPFRRYVALNRSLGAWGEDNTAPGLGLVGQFLTQQYVLSAPSVFNFYLPGFLPKGELGEAGLVAPEFQITNASTLIGVTNLMAYALYSEQSIDTPEGFTTIKPDLSPFTEVASDPDELLARINLVFFAGTMSEQTEQIINAALLEYAGAGVDEQGLAQVGLYLALISPDYAIAGEVQ